MKVGGPPLPPAWPHMPVGYAGRTSSIIVSGTAIHRPKGMLPPSPSNPQPSFGPEKALDMEFEMAAIVGGPGNQMGDSFGPDETLENIFGLVIMNDWSARSVRTQGEERGVLTIRAQEHPGLRDGPAWTIQREKLCDDHIALDCYARRPGALQDDLAATGRSHELQTRVETG